MEAEKILLSLVCVVNEKSGPRKLRTDRGTPKRGLSLGKLLICLKHIFKG